ncbi:conjugal transfer nickase/helicase domain-containing protein [Klebsiella pneumoniae]|uniref:conjugal transfer nickase/helicase domain-containing protein n=1 Tax=Klebsiella pneumoniae TaxID=573 RepID=UPI002DBAB6E9|nr:DNA-binding domain-containing protein [Klebsiella pneumoniae]MEB6282222.1 DNA-binding domain-containing protein [Klebsiella pneumoniae]
MAEEPHQFFSHGEYPERQGTCGGKPSFLISPGIFKTYAAETTGDSGDGWKLAQRMFQESGLALRCNDDSFIWSCEVRVPQKKSSQLKGFLIEDPKQVLGEKVPVNNPWLKLLRE